MFKRIIASFVCFTFAASTCPSVFAQGFSVSDLPVPGTMVSVSPSFEPALIKGLTVHQDNPFLFDFIVDPGQSKVSKAVLKDESERMIKYFFAALTIPDKDVWVNLSPYEKDRMIPVTLGQTAMGRDLLAQDYMLKQLTASLIYPQKDLGKAFWDKVYSRAKEMYGTTQVPVNTFNKVWIVPQKVGIYEHGQTAFIVSGHLKVMLEEDYLALGKNQAGCQASKALNVKAPQVNNLTHNVASNIVRAIILPEIEKEINDGKNFATLRQIFYAQALAVWFKRNLKQALLNQVYADKGTVKGIDQNDPATNEAIYHQYLKAYKKGVFNFIHEDMDPVTQETLPRKYFSGGYNEADMALVTEPMPPTEMALIPRDEIMTVVAADKAMLRTIRKGILIPGLLALGAAITVGSGVKIYNDHQRMATAAYQQQQIKNNIIRALHQLKGVTEPSDYLQSSARRQILAQGPAAVEVLMPFAQDPTQETNERKWAINALGYVADPKAPKVRGFLKAVENNTIPGDFQEWHIIEANNALAELNWRKEGHSNDPAIDRAQQVMTNSEKFPNLVLRSSIPSDQAMSSRREFLLAGGFLGVLAILLTPTGILSLIEEHKVNNLRNRAIGLSKKFYQDIPFKQNDPAADFDASGDLTVRDFKGLLGGTDRFKSYVIQVNSLEGSEDGDVIPNGQKLLVPLRQMTYLRLFFNQEPIKYVKEFVFGNGSDPRPILVKSEDDDASSVIKNTPEGYFYITALLTPEEFNLLMHRYDDLPYGVFFRKHFYDYYFKRLKQIAGDPAQVGGAITPGGIDLSQQEAALHVEKDANGGVKVSVDRALVARIEREGMDEVDPVIIDMRPADARSILGLPTKETRPFSFS